MIKHNPISSTKPLTVHIAVEWFTSHEHPELIFLNIHLTEGDAFDFLSGVKPKSAVIFKRHTLSMLS